MKKQLALILVLALLFSIITPLQAVAASTNRITSVPTVQEDDLIYDLAPRLVIEEKGSDFGNDRQFFTLSLKTPNGLVTAPETKTAIWSLIPPLLFMKWNRQLVMETAP